MTSTSFHIYIRFIRIIISIALTPSCSTSTRAQQTTVAALRGGSGYICSTSECVPMANTIRVEFASSWIVALFLYSSLIYCFCPFLNISFSLSAHSQDRTSRRTARQCHSVWHCQDSLAFDICVHMCASASHLPHSVSVSVRAHLISTILSHPIAAFRW